MTSTRALPVRVICFVLTECAPSGAVHLIPAETPEKVSIESAKPAIDAFDQGASLLSIRVGVLIFDLCTNLGFVVVLSGDGGLLAIPIPAHRCVSGNLC